MNEAPTPALVSPEWVSSLLSIACSAEIPPAFLDLVDPAACAELIEGSKLGIVAGAGPVAIRLAHDAESERLFAAVSKAFPAVAGWLGAQVGRDALFETDGERLRVYVYGVEGSGGQVGVVWEDGVAGTIHPATTPAGSPEGGEWVELRLGSQRSTVGVYGPDARTALAPLGGDVIAAVLAHYTSAGLVVGPWSIEHGPAGVRVCAWGAYTGQDDELLPEELDPDRLGAAEAFARHLSRLVPDGEVEAARTFVAKSLFPALHALKKPEQEFADFAADARSFVVGSLAFHPPEERLEVLRRLAAVNRMPRIQVEATNLAIARYLQLHPEATAPADLPDEVVALSESGLRDKALALQAEVDALEPIVAADPDANLHRLTVEPFTAVAIRDAIERALTGEFHHAEGALNDFLLGLGTLGYDDDPAMVTLEDVDLEPKDRDAVLEEALARQDDDEG